MTMTLLNDLRSEYVKYVSEHVKVLTSAIRPAVPGTLNPNEEFSFDVTVRNGEIRRVMGMDMPDGVPIVDLRIGVYVATGPGQLIVSALRVIREIRSDARDASTILSPGQLVPSMWLLPVVTQLKVGDEIVVKGLKGKATGALGAIRLTVYAEACVDLEWLFPKDSPIGGAQATIAGDVV